VLLPEGSDRDRVMSELQTQGIETRPAFYPAHHMPMYAQALDLPIAEAIAARGISLPSYPNFTDRDVERVAFAMLAELRVQGLAGERRSAV